MIRIGADELILWLRKNGIAINITNDGRHGLGRLIYELIVNQLGGQKVAHSRPSHWTNTTEYGRFNLPKTSAQYQIGINRLDVLYSTISTW